MQIVKIEAADLIAVSRLVNILGHDRFQPAGKYRQVQIGHQILIFNTVFDRDSLLPVRRAGRRRGRAD